MAPRAGVSHTSELVGLLVPTSLCSSQVSQMLAERLSTELTGLTGLGGGAQPVHVAAAGSEAEAGSTPKPGLLSKIIALPRTEGCGSACRCWASPASRALCAVRRFFAGLYRLPRGVMSSGGAVSQCFATDAALMLPVFCSPFLCSPSPSLTHAHRSRRGGEQLHPDNPGLCHAPGGGLRGADRARLRDDPQ